MSTYNLAQGGNDIFLIPNATFFVDQTAASTGVLLATLTGSYNDQYTFSAEKK